MIIEGNREFSERSVYHSPREIRKVLLEEQSEMSIKGCCCPLSLSHFVLLLWQPFHPQVFVPLWNNSLRYDTLTCKVS